jgi:hypothetical protein
MGLGTQWLPDGPEIASKSHIQEGCDPTASRAEKTHASRLPETGGQLCDMEYRSEQFPAISTS